MVASGGPLVAEVCIAPMAAVVDAAPAVEFSAGGTDGVVAAVVEAAVGPVVAEVCVAPLVAVVVALAVGDPVTEVCAAAAA